MINEAINYVVKSLKSGKKVLIHCNQGESRAPSIAFLVLKKLCLLKETFAESILLFRTLYPSFQPSKGILEYVKNKWDL